MDESYQTHANRVMRITLPETYHSQLQNIQASPKFQPQPFDGQWQALPFPGYTIITPPWEDDSENAALYTNLQACQQELLQKLPTNLLVPVPPSSFHLTVADLIWDSAYRHTQAENPAFEPQLQEAITQTFQQCQPLLADRPPVYWQVLGLMLMPRALGACLVPKEASSYESIVQLRRAIYQNSKLIGLGVEQQYHFTAHVTLGYFGSMPADSERDGLSRVLSEINQQWLETPQTLHIHRTELRKFDDMTRYYREPDWPVLEL